MFKKYLLQLKIRHLRDLREQKGQSLIIFVFAIMGIIAMMGLALDLGLVYIERVRVSRTTDAAALAAVVELPFEEEAMRRAIEYIELNGYTQQDTEIRVRGCIQIPDPPPPPFSSSLAGKIRNVGEGADPAVVNDDIYNPDATVDVEPDDLTSGYIYQHSLTDPPRNIFVIDTLAYQPVERDAANVVTSKNKDNCDGGSSPLYGTANKLRVSGQVDVDMNFMQFFGRGTVAVSDQAVGENVTNLDVVVVFDVSGSMDYETNCFGCWVKGIPGDPDPDIMTHPYPTNGTNYQLSYSPNAGGGPYSIYWDNNTATTPNNDVCKATPTSRQIAEGGTGTPYHYLVHEAEFYSRTYPTNGWEFPKHRAGEGFWVLQKPSAGENASNDAYISAHPFVTYSQNNINLVPQIQGGTYDSNCFAENPAAAGEYGPYGECWEPKGLPDGVPEDPPYVEYDFTPDWTGDLHIWVRAIGGWQWSYEWDGKNPAPPTTLKYYRPAMFWQVDDGPVGGGKYELLGRKAKRDEVNTATALTGPDRWRWVKIADEQNTPPVVAGEHHVLRIYQGSSGFNLDKIIITDNPEGDIFNTVMENGKSALVVTDDTDVTNAGRITSAGSNSDRLQIAIDVLSLNTGKGPDASDGSATREACNKCNPAYGETVDLAQCTCRETGETSGAGTGDVQGCTFVTEQTNQFSNDLFYDRAPLRNAKEAVKNFAARLDPKFDQLGVVAFNNQTPERTKLQCLVYAGFEQCASSSTNPITYSYVIKDLEEYTNYEATNISLGLREGLEELGVSVPGYNGGVGHDCPTAPSPLPSDPPSSLHDNDKEACDRRGAARRVLVLMTDGTPSRWPGYPSDPGSCPANADALWQGQIGAGNQAYDCAIFYAQEAAQNNVVLYVIGIGAGVNDGLLKAMATGTDDMGTPEDTSDDIVYFNDKGGEFFPAATPDQLDSIFESILSNIYVRIVG